MSFLWKVVGLSGSVPNFPFKFDTGKSDYTHSTSTLPWTIRQGTRIEDGLPISIFTTTIPKGKTTHDTKDENVKVLARNTLKYSKNLMLPGILRCYGGVEYDGCVYIATERCNPLSNVLANAGLLRDYYGDQVGYHYEQGVALGLKHVAEALIGLEKNGLIHGNVCGESVYVTANGFWRLWGLELVSPCSAEGENKSHNASVYQQLATSFLPQYRIPDAMAMRYAMVDAWGMACLIFEAFRGRSSVDTETALLSSKNVHSCQRQLPDSLQASFKRLLSGRMNARCGIAQFLENCDFIQQSAYVQCLSDIDQYMLMDASQREAFMDRLSSSVPDFPLRVCLMVILPKLMELTQMDTPPVNIVNPVLDIAKLVIDDGTFHTHISPCLMQLFQSTNLAIRYCLLQSVDIYGSRLSEATLEKIWPFYSKGITSTSASVRDGSVRALVHIAMRLPTRVMTQEVPFLLQQVQNDADGTIRTNATIALSLIAPHLPAESRPRILLPAFGRMLKDPFAPSRVAALQSLRGIMGDLKTEELSEVVIPRVAPLVMDSIGDVRCHAVEILKSALERFEDHHRLCLEEEKAHRLQHGQQPDVVSDKAPSSHSLAEGIANHGSRLGSFQGGRAKTYLPQPFHPVSSSSQSHSDGNNNYLGLTRDSSQGLQQRHVDVCDGWKENAEDLKLPKEDDEAKDMDSDGWGEVVQMPMHADPPSPLLPLATGLLQDANVMLGDSLLSSGTPLSVTKQKVSPGPISVHIPNDAPCGSVVNGVKPANVMKLRSKKNRLGAIRLD